MVVVVILKKFKHAAVAIAFLEFLSGEMSVFVFVQFDEEILQLFELLFLNFESGENGQESFLKDVGMVKLLKADNGAIQPTTMIFLLINRYIIDPRMFYQLVC